MAGPRSLVAFVIGLLTSSVARADLDGYIKKPDPSYGWEVLSRHENKLGKITYLKLTSQTWRGKPWVHHLNIYEPKEIKYPDAMLLIIAGGNTDDGPPGSGAAARGFAAANACGARVAQVQEIPNQPLLDGKHEDELLAETLLQAITTGDDTWPLLFPMAKSAVRAMDAAQEWAKNEGKPVSRFVVTGSSKRGWTTFLTAAVDPRVIAIAPMVFPNLNMKAQNAHALESWGKPSEEIVAYTKRGLTSQSAQADASVAKVRTWIDPYTYRDRFTMPLLQINGANDAYWTLDSLNLYWDDLKGPKSVLYIPNAGHNLEPHVDWAVNAVGALFRHSVTGKPMPIVTGDFRAEPVGAVECLARAGGAKKITIWGSAAPTRDFREAKWQVLGDSGGSPEFRVIEKRPETGYLAMLGIATFEVDGLEFHLSTPTHIFAAEGKK